jgi:hypothetical protein
LSASPTALQISHGAGLVDATQPLLDQRALLLAHLQHLLAPLLQV